MLKTVMRWLAVTGVLSSGALGAACSNQTEIGSSCELDLTLLFDWGPGRPQTQSRSTPLPGGHALQSVEVVDQVPRTVAVQATGGRGQNGYANGAAFVAAAADRLKTLQAGLQGLPKVTPLGEPWFGDPLGWAVAPLQNGVDTMTAMGVRGWPLSVQTTVTFAYSARPQRYPVRLKLTVIKLGLNQLGQLDAQGTAAALALRAAQRVQQLPLPIIVDNRCDFDVKAQVVVLNKALFSVSAPFEVKRQSKGLPPRDPLMTVRPGWSVGVALSNLIDTAQVRGKDGQAGVNLPYRDVPSPVYPWRWRTSGLENTAVFCGR